MKVPENITHMYFLGIGGIGMSALARYYNKAGVEIAGYDKTPSSLTAQMITEGMDIHFEEDPDLIPTSFLEAPKENVLVVYTPAIPAEHGEWIWFRERGYTIRKRSEVLGMLTEGTRTVAVAGTHGKTTTSSLIAHLLRTAGTECWAFLGGITQNYESNMLEGTTDIVVVEADEYDRSFLTLRPLTAIITSLDPDHLDIYGDHSEMLRTYSLFAAGVKPGGVLVTKQGLKEYLGHPSAGFLEYCGEGTAPHRAENVRVENGRFVFDLILGDTRIANLNLGVPGRHNVENAVGAVTAVWSLGVSEQAIRKGLASFRGVKRRFEYHIRRDDLVLIDDYAHHPAELSATIAAVRDLYPGKRITGVFQPHLFTRTRDFADDFARSLEKLDQLVLLDIYPARELPIPGVNTTMLLNKVRLENKCISSKKELPDLLSSSHYEVVLLMGAGDIELLAEPVKRALE
ncbi:MAG: UDP-N-acetylmuramate--L-alanine ligase [Bacteroidia bacterium]|nr:UDP-N-acetylmuramate--L-alanine ligase [Bacteroidia bacterium]